MTFPLAPQGVFGHEAGLVLGVLIGIAFGFVLERSGFGRAPNLAAQFYFSDMRVLKVMFTAIVTAMLGLVGLDGLHVLDLSLVTVPETFLAPQIVGGLLLGVGFIVSGYCPGTAVVAAGGGAIDGVVTIVGVGLGSLVYGLAWPWIADFHGSGAMGVVRLPEVLGVPQALLAAGVFVMATGMFLGGEWAERFFARRRAEPAPAAVPALRNRVLAVLVAGVVLALAGLAIPPATQAAPEVSVGSMGALDLARVLVEQPERVHLLDLRTPEDCARGTIPGARCREAGDAPLGFVADLPAGRTMVVFDQGTPADLPDEVRAWDGSLARLDGGFEAFNATLLVPPTPPEGTDTAAIEAYRMRSALHAFFTGAAAPSAVPSPAKTAAPRRGGPKKGGGC